MTMSADHQACSPEIDSITSDSDQSCNLFCQKSCRLVLLLWLLFFFPPWPLSLLDILPYSFLWAWFLWWYLHLLFLLCTQPLNICTISSIRACSVGFPFDYALSFYVWLSLLHSSYDITIIKMYGNSSNCFFFIFMNSIIICGHIS